MVNAVIYDTVYAHQDLSDDLEAGVMSMAVACAGHTKKVLYVLSMVEIALLATTGYLLGFGVWFWGAAVGGTAIVLEWMIVTVTLEEPEDCWRWFILRHAALRQRAGKEINPSACFEVSRRYNPDRSYFYYMTERTGPIGAFHSFF